MQAPSREVIAPAEGDNPTLAKEAVEFKLLEGQRLELADKASLLCWRDQLGRVAEALGESQGVRKEIRLLHASCNAALKVTFPVHYGKASEYNLLALI